MKKRYPALPVVEGIAFRVFDIVNGFLIDAVAHGATGLRTGRAMRHLQMYIWLRLSSAPIPARALCRPVVDGVDSQA